MGNATRNYCAFYVSEPFDPSHLAAHATKDFVYYNLLKTWKGKDPQFPFRNAHESTYNVRDDSSWESTLKPRLHERLGNSKNIIFFLSSETRSSKALKEEIEYGISALGLPVIVVYPEITTKSGIFSEGKFTKHVENLWSKEPAFKKLMNDVPILHVPMDKELIKAALENKDLMLSTKIRAGNYR